MVASAAVLDTEIDDKFVENCGTLLYAGQDSGLDRDESAWRIRGASLSWRFPGMVNQPRG